MKNTLFVVLLSIAACASWDAVRTREGVAAPSGDSHRGAPAAADVARGDRDSPPSEFATDDSLIPIAEGRARARRARTLREPAYLYVETEPTDATIQVDGSTEGHGRAFFRSGGSRFHEVTVSAPGFETVEGYVELEERDVLKLRVAMRRTGGKLTLLTEPQGAVVEVDGAVMGHTPITLRYLAPGVHRLALTLGSSSMRRTVTISPTETTVVDVAMGEEASPPPAPPVAEPARAPAPAPAPPPVVEPAPAPAPPPVVEPASPPPPPVVEPAPAPAPATAGGAGKPNCGAICDRYVQPVSGSGTMRDVIAKRCRERCDAGDMRFSVCAWKTRTLDDVSACASLPETH